MSRALVLGSTGQLGTELLRQEWPRGYQTIAPSLEDLDFSEPETLFDKALALKPDVIVNAAAYTAVDKAEAEEPLAYKVNALAPEALARAAARLDVPFLHVSTDYVFDGELVGREYIETDSVAPVNAYGRTKERGEVLVRAAHQRHVILRTSWVYSSFGSNFVKTMLRVGRDRPELKVVADQVGRPTHAGELAQALIRTLSAIEDGVGAFGTYHYAGGRAMSWHAFAEAIFASATKHGYVPPRVAAITTAEYPTPARRPRNSRLDGSKLAVTFGIEQHDFDAALDRCVGELMKET